VIDHALSLTASHSLSHWDSILLAAWLDGGVSKLYTEDMGAPRMIGGISLVNPYS
jgi:predicted nucleic acid-binding protein